VHASAGPKKSELSLTVHITKGGKEPVFRRRIFEGKKG